MKAKELTPCVICGEGLMHAGVPLIYRITIEVMGIGLPAVRERQDLQVLFGQILVPTEEIANRVHEPSVLLVCQPCAQSVKDTLRDVLLGKMGGANTGLPGAR